MHSTLHPDSTCSILGSLQHRVTDIETLRASRVAGNGSVSALLTQRETPEPAQDAFACEKMVDALAYGFSNTLFARCPDNYYGWRLEQRRAFLSAPSVAHLTKSIVVENTRFMGSSDGSDPLSSRFFCVLVQYVHSLNMESITRLVRGMLADAGREVPGVNKFNFRLAGDCLGITGFEPNAVMPLGLATAMPVILDRNITLLKPAFFWLGGGEVSLKWKVDISEFCAAFHPIVANVTAEKGNEGKNKR